MFNVYYVHRRKKNELIYTNNHQNLKLTSSTELVESPKELISFWVPPNLL
jgi:hypothetical protein